MRSPKEIMKVRRGKKSEHWPARESFSHFLVAFHLLRARRDHFASIKILTYLVLKKFSLCQLCSDYSTLLRDSFTVLISTDIHKEGRKKKL